MCQTMTVSSLQCRHCGRNFARRCRGLCWACYYTPGVRDRYPKLPRGRYVYQSHDSYGCRPLPTEPTAALPGTLAKMDVLAARVEAGVALHHPLDARRNDAEPRTWATEDEDTEA